MLVTTDLHLTDRERDEYRWEIFPWLREHLELGSHKALVILGDLTDAKDCHSSTLVNRIITNISSVCEMGVEVFILKGNHDYIDPTSPFFDFLNQIEGVTFVVEPARYDVEEMEVLMLPHERDPQEAWDDLIWGPILDNPPHWIGCHQTFNGARASNGFDLQSSISSKYFSGHGYEGMVLAGDIHVPQDLGDVTYVGTPYPVNFGDAYEPRVLEVDFYDDELGAEDLNPPTIRKRAVEISSVEPIPRMQKGDQLKLKVRLLREEFPEWEEIRRSVVEQAEQRGAYVHSVELVEEEPAKKMTKRATAYRPSSSPIDTLAAFCEASGLTEGERHAAEDVLRDLV